MKKTATLIAGIVSGLVTIQAQTMPLYLNFNSHNEISDNIQYSSAGVWTQYRGYVLQLAGIFSNAGAKWNLQADSDFILADHTRESAFTNPNDLLDSLDATPTVEVDPHNHFDNNASSPSYNPYNYSDLAHLLDSAGLNGARKNLGGFLWGTASDWMPYQNLVPGNVYPSYTWRPDVVWGAGSPGHTNDYNGYGVWKPQGAGLGFLNHDPTKHLTFIGNGCSLVITDTTHVSTIVNQIVQMIQYIHYQPYNSMNMYTASIQMNFRDFSANYIDTVAAIVQGLQPYVTSGDIVYQTLTEKYTTWYNAHSNVQDHFKLDCQGLPLNTGEVNGNKAVANVWPNPAADVMHLNSDTEAIIYLSIYNSGGQLVFRKQQNTSVYQTEVDVSELPAGIYLLSVQTENGILNKRIVIAR